MINDIAKSYTLLSNGTISIRDNLCCCIQLTKVYRDAQRPKESANLEPTPFKLAFFTQTIYFLPVRVGFPRSSNCLPLDNFAFMTN
jgi:hypothetical protein